MPELNLPEPQRKILGQMVQASDAAGSPTFTFSDTFAGTALRFGRAQEQVELDLDDLHLFVALGLMSVRWASGSGILLPAAAELVKCKFKLPDPVPPQIGLLNTGTLHAGQLQAAAGSHNRLSQSGTPQDVRDALSKLDALVCQFPEQVQGDLRDGIADVEDEASKRDPKPSRLNAFIVRLTSLAGGAAAAAEFIHKLGELARVLGLSRATQ